MNLLRPRREKLYKLLFLLVVIFIPLVSVGYSALQTTLNIATNVASPNIVTITYDCTGGNGEIYYDIAAIGESYELQEGLCERKIITGSGNGVSATPNVYEQTGWSLADGGSKITSITVSGDATLYPYYEKSFTYTTSYEVAADDPYYTVKLLTTGVYTPLQNGSIDVFAVGGGGAGSNVGSTSGYQRGGGGGAGGYTEMYNNIEVIASTSYNITVGAGGTAVSGNIDAASGEESSMVVNGYSYNAQGGEGGKATGAGGTGGSGGTAGNVWSGKDGGSNGSDGTTFTGSSGNTSFNISKGYGQNSTTALFGDESTGIYYSPGGGGGCGTYAGDNAVAGQNGAGLTGPNSGAGGNGGNYKNLTPHTTGSSGESGVVIIRNRPYPDTNTLTYNNNGGTGCTSKGVTYGEKVGSLCIPTRTNYTFFGWYTAALNGAHVTVDTIVTGDQTVYAIWIPNFTYTGDYEFNYETISIKFTSSGTFTPAINTLADIFAVGGGGGGGAASEPDNWRTGGGGGGGGYTATVLDVQLTANTGYVITIGAGGTSGDQANGGTGGTSSFGNIVSAAGGIGGTRSGVGGNGGSGGGSCKNYGGGNGGANGSAGSSVNSATAGTGQGTTTAVFGEESFGVYYSPGGGGGGGRPGGSGGPSGSVGTPGLTGPNSGAGGTGGNCGGNRYAYYAGTAGKTGVVLLRSLGLEKYTLTYDNNGGSGCTSKEITQTRTFGDLCEPTRTDYVFAGWYTSASGGDRVSENTLVTGNQTIHAHWVALSSIPPTCTVEIVENDLVDGITTSVICNVGGSLCDDGINPTGDTNLTSSKTYTVYDVNGNSATCSVTIGTQRQRQTLECHETYGKNCNYCGYDDSCSGNNGNCSSGCASCWYCKGSQDQYWSTWSDVSSCTENSTTHCRTVYRGTPN